MDTLNPASQNTDIPTELADVAASKAERKREQARQRQARWWAKRNPEDIAARNAKRREDYNFDAWVRKEGNTLTDAVARRILRTHPARIAKWRAHASKLIKQYGGPSQRQENLNPKIRKLSNELRRAARLLGCFYDYANITDPFPAEWGPEEPCKIIPASWMVEGPDVQPPHDWVMHWFLSEADALAYVASEQAAGRGPWGPIKQYIPGAVSGPITG
jgi:hypothetical protein